MPFPSVLCLLSVYSFCFQIKLNSSSYHQLWYFLYMLCKMICSVQLPFLTISIQTSYKWAFASSGTFQILPPVSDHQIRACIFPDNFLHNFCLWTESIRFTVIKMIEPSFHPKFLPVCLTI